MNKLKLVQKVLSALDMENVNEIGDTVESEQVAEIIDKVYADVLRDYPWPHLYTIGTLEVTDENNVMRLPTDVFQVDWIRYNKKELSYLSPKDMVILLDSRDVTLDNIDANGCYTDRDPVYWTTFDDYNITFDSYNGTLEANKSKCQFIRDPGMVADDETNFDLPSRFVPVLLSGCLAEGFLTLKGDDSLGNFYYRQMRLGIIDMKKWARRVSASTPRTYDDDVSYARGYTHNSNVLRISTSE